MQVKLTCVTAVYNAVRAGKREQLVRCIRSIPALQAVHEHLVYDGASDDGTVDVLRELEAVTPNLRVVSEPDSGLYNALNKGVRDAKGEWFYVLGADDYIVHPEVMDRILREDDGAEVLVASVERDRGFPFIRKMSDLKGIVWHVPYSHQGTIMRTSVVRQYHGFDERFRICADWDMMRKEHDDARRFKYFFTPFAFYAANGASESGAVGQIEMHQVIREHAGLSLAQYERSRKRGYYPLRETFRFCFHKDRAYRIAGRSLVCRRAKAYLRLLFYPLVVLTRPIRHRR